MRPEAPPVPRMPPGSLASAFGYRPPAQIGGPSPGARDNPGEAYPNQPASKGPATTADANSGSDAAPPIVDPYDYSQDPILQKIQAYDIKARTDARAAALTARNQLAITLGDAAGLTDDTATAQAAANNPFSTLARLLHGYQDADHQHGEQLNNENLWYSGAHEKQGVDDANAYQGQVYDARQAALGQLGGINSGLAQALSGADTADINAEGDAATRAQQRATAYGYDPGATSGTTNPATGAGPGFGGTGGPTIAQAMTAKTKYTVPVITTGAAPKTPKVPKMPNAYLTNPNKRG